MKKTFSTHWKASKRPTKQRKYRENSPLHLRQKLLGATLSKTLRKTQGRRSVPLRKGDTIKIMRGKFAKKQGKVTKILTKQGKVYVEGIDVKKMEGSKALVALRASNLQIVQLHLDDKKRLLKQQSEKPKKAEQPETKQKPKEKK